MKAKGILILLMAMTLLLLVGCSNDAMEGTVTDISATPENKLDILIKNIPPDYAAQLAQTADNRSILPTPYDVADSLTWYICGLSTSGVSYGPTLLTVTNTADSNDTTGTTSIPNLTAAVWNLTLYAYLTAESPAPTTTDESSIKSVSVLVGYASTDLRHGASTVTFDMITEGLTKQGSVKVTGTYIDGTYATTSTSTDYAAKAYKFGLYNRVTGAVVSESTSQVVGTASSVATGTVADPAKWTITDVTIPSVDPGTYLFAATFYNDASTLDETTQVGYYSDLIVVDPGNETTATLSDIDVIQTIPAAPTAFCAYLVDDSEDAEYYKVKLNWTDNSYNETNFVLSVTKDNDNDYVIDDDDDATADADTDATGITYGLDATGADVELYGSEIYSSGSILAGSETVTLRLKLGEIYEIQLYAINKAGKSTTVSRTTASVPAVTGHTAYTTGPINRMRILYHLNGGTLTISSTDYTGIYTEYNTYDGTTNTYTLNATMPVINSTAAAFWAEYPDGTTAITTVDSRLNRDVQAIWTITGNIKTPTYTDLAAASLYTCDDGSDTNISAALTVTNNKLTLTNPKYLKVVIDNASGTYRSYAAKFGGEWKVTETASVASSYTMYLNLSNYEGNKYNMNILVEDTNGQWLSYTITVTVSR